MKKLLSLILVACLIVFNGVILTACNKKDDEKTKILLSSENYMQFLEIKCYASPVTDEYDDEYYWKNDVYGGQKSIITIKFYLKENVDFYSNIYVSLDLKFTADYFGPREDSQYRLEHKEDYITKSLNNICINSAFVKEQYEYSRDKLSHIWDEEVNVLAIEGYVLA